MERPTDDQLAALGRMASRYVPTAHEVLLRVFGQAVAVTTEPMFHAGDNGPLRREAVVVGGWLWLYQNGGDDWVVRVSVPPGAGFNWPCIGSMQGQLAVKRTFEDALLLAVLHESHVRMHRAVREIGCAADGAFT